MGIVLVRNGTEGDCRVISYFAERRRHKWCRGRKVEQYVSPDDFNYDSAWSSGKSWRPGSSPSRCLQSFYPGCVRYRPLAPLPPPHLWFAAPTPAGKSMRVWLRGGRFHLRSSYIDNWQSKLCWSSLQQWRHPSVRLHRWQMGVSVPTK